MIDTILFDLDGTLLHFSQEAFIGAYFAQLGKIFHRLGLDPEASAKAVWVGTKAMVLNDGSRYNIERFWESFADTLGLTDQKRGEIEAACDHFYLNEFDTVRSVVRPGDLSNRIVRGVIDKGYGVVLATNPLFPLGAVQTRLGWIGLSPSDFLLVTHYANSKYCKPNPGYYKEIFANIDRAPAQCLMVGNNPVEDMCAGRLGAQTFLVTDCLENEAGADITPFRSGTLAELEYHLLSLPDIQ